MLATWIALFLASSLIIAARLVGDINRPVAYRDAALAIIVWLIAVIGISYELTTPRTGLQGTAQSISDLNLYTTPRDN